MHLSRTPIRYAVLVLLCAFLAVFILPVQAGLPAQTLPTAGPSPTSGSGNNPGENPTAPAPTARLATSPVQGIQPSPSVTLTNTPLATLETAVQTPTVMTATPGELSVTLTANATATQPPDPALQWTETQAANAALPTLPVAAPAEPAQSGGAWCFPVAVLLLAVLIFLVIKWMRRSAK